MTGLTVVELAERISEAHGRVAEWYAPVAGRRLGRVCGRPLAADFARPGDGQSGARPPSAGPRRRGSGAAEQRRWHEEDGVSGRASIVRAGVERVVLAPVALGPVEHLGEGVSARTGRSVDREAATREVGRRGRREACLEEAVLVSRTRIVTSGSSRLGSGISTVSSSEGVPTLPPGSARTSAERRPTIPLGSPSGPGSQNCNTDRTGSHSSASSTTVLLAPTAWNFATIVSRPWTLRSLSSSASRSSQVSSTVSPAMSTCTRSRWPSSIQGEPIAGRFGERAAVGELTGEDQGALLSRSDLAELGWPRRGVDAIFRRCPSS